MMDIVERLCHHKSSDVWTERKDRTWYETDDLCMEAADEIERLREALQFYASKNNYKTKKVWTKTLMIKNIAFPQYEPDGYKIVSQYHTPVLSDNGEKARAALKEGE